MKKSSDEAKEPILSVKWMLPEFKPIYIVLLHRKKKQRQGTWLEFWNSVLEDCIQKRSYYNFGFSHLTVSGPET